MMLTELLRQNRSYRGFFQTPRLTRAQLTQLVELTRLCPSSGNVQPLKYLLSWENDTNRRIFAMLRWAGRMKEPKLPHPGMEPTAYIIILHDLSIAPNAAAFARDVGIVAHTILLGASEAGFGGCMLGAFSAQQLSQTLALPENLQPALVLALGRPAETILLHDAPPGFVDRDHCYYRDENDAHHVWKRPLEELIATTPSGSSEP